MAKQVKRSVLPIYLVGVTWMVCALFFSLRSMTDYLLCAIVSAGVFVAGDCANPLYKQAVVAASTGAQAAQEAQHYIDNFENRETVK